MECIFCKIVNKEIPAKIIAENKGAIAFLDVNPVSDGHTIIIPKKHFMNLSQCSDEYLADVINLTKIVSKNIQDSFLKPWGINYLSNEGNIAGQEIMHFHIHVIPKYGKDEGFKIGIGNKYLGNIDKIYNELKEANLSNKKTL
ncbi:MAG: HIT family protein [Mycoplasmataceae bacterium]|nr:HIT family protein [Mycoplasmataceae bacterium]